MFGIRYATMNAKRCLYASCSFESSVSTLDFHVFTASVKSSASRSMLMTNPTSTEAVSRAAKAGLI